MPDPKEEKKFTPEQVMEAVNALREEVQKANPDQEVIVKANKLLDEHEESNQKFTTQLQEAKNAATDLEQKVKELEESGTATKSQMEALEAEIARGAASPADVKFADTEDGKVMKSFVQNGEIQMPVELKALMRTDSDIAGGYLVPSEMDNIITRKITEVSAIRSISRVRTVGSKSLEMPIRDTLLEAFYEGEAEEDQQGENTYSNESLNTFRLSVTVPVTKDLLMNSAFDMESEIMTDAAEAFAQKEGNKFVLGTGVKQPAGFTANAILQAAARESTTGGAIDPEDWILLTGDLKVGYNPVYVMNRGTLADLRTKKSTTGSFIWEPGLNGAVANTLNGFPYIIAQDMPAIANGAYAGAFGDFRRGYTIVDRTGLSIVRDELTQKRKAIVEFTFNRWNYGQVTLPEAIKLLKVKT